MISNLPPHVANPFVPVGTGTAPVRMPTVEPPSAHPPEPAPARGGVVRRLGLGLLSLASPLVVGACEPAPAAPPVPAPQTQTVRSPQVPFAEGRRLVEDRAEAARARPAPTPSPRPTQGVRFDFTASEVDSMTRNSVTLSELPAGAPRFTPAGADSSQGSKLYHDPQTLELDEQHAGRLEPLGERFVQCGAISGERCQSSRSNQVKYSVISCIYVNEADGQLYRVTQRSLQHDATPPMQRNVCGGHRLEYDPAQMSYTPRQATPQGETLYLNPANVMRIHTLTPAEQAAYPR